MDQKKNSVDFNFIYGSLPGKQLAICKTLLREGPMSARDLAEILPYGQSEMAVRIMLLELVRKGGLRAARHTKEIDTGHSATVFELSWQRPHAVKKESYSQKCIRLEKENSKLKNEIAELKKTLEAKPHGTTQRTNYLTRGIERI